MLLEEFWEWGGEKFHFNWIFVASKSLRVWDLGKKSRGMPKNHGQGLGIPRVHSRRAFPTSEIPQFWSKLESHTTASTQTSRPPWNLRFPGEFPWFLEDFQRTNTWIGLEWSILFPKNAGFAIPKGRKGWDGIKTGIRRGRSSSWRSLETSGKMGKKRKNGG